MIEEFEKKLKEDGRIKKNTNNEKKIQELHTEFKKNVTSYFRENHMHKIRDVVGMLPLSELAELSETLVHIESLKERVTTEEESVSGPIDVAIISKNDGFIWIRRKHYFDGSLNPRYAQRTKLGGN